MTVRITDGGEYNARITVNNAGVIPKSILCYTFHAPVNESRHYYVPRSRRLEVFLLVYGSGGGGRIPSPSRRRVSLPLCCKEVRFTRGRYDSYERLEESLVDSFVDEHRT